MRYSSVAQVSVAVLAIPAVLACCPGGSWFNGVGCRSAFRGAIGPDGIYCDYGFRLVKVPEGDSRNLLQELTKQTGVLYH